MALRNGPISAGCTYAPRGTIVERSMVLVESVPVIRDHPTPSTASGQVSAIPIELSFPRLSPLICSLSSRPRLVQMWETANSLRGNCAYGILAWHVGEYLTER